jgi:hypothetical protein
VTTASDVSPGAVGRYIELGLALGRHIDGFVDAYYGPPGPARRAAVGPPLAPDRLVTDARSLIASLDAGVLLDDVPGPAESDLATAARRRWLRAQVVGLLTTARRLAGESVGYVEEVEACYGVRPAPVSDEDIAAAHQRLTEALPGTGPIADRLIAWRESHVVDPERLPDAIASLAEDLRERTHRLFGLSDGEHIDFELVRDKPWSGFNTYLGDLHSRVDINTDLPVLSLSLAHLVAHEAYPGHHTEHTRKEVGLVRRLHREEECIFLVGTPQCVLAEGLADLGLEVVVGPRPETVIAGHLRPLGIAYDADQIALIGDAVETLSAVRGNAALLLHDRGMPADDVIDYLSRWALLSRPRAEKALQFLADPTWRAYVFCYIEGLDLCRRFVRGDPARFERLISEQLLPADLRAA